MSPNGTPFGASAAKCEKLVVEKIRTDVADTAVRSAIAPGPAAGVVEQFERVAWLQPADQFGVRGGRTAEVGR